VKPADEECSVQPNEYDGIVDNLYYVYRPLLRLADVVDWRRLRGQEPQSSRDLGTGRRQCRAFSRGSREACAAL